MMSFSDNNGLRDISFDGCFFVMQQDLKLYAQNVSLSGLTFNNCRFASGNTMFPLLLKTPNVDYLRIDKCTDVPEIFNDYFINEPTNNNIKNVYVGNSILGRNFSISQIDADDIVISDCQMRNNNERMTFSGGSCNSMTIANMQRAVIQFIDFSLQSLSIVNADTIGIRTDAKVINIDNMRISKNMDNFGLWCDSSSEINMSNIHIYTSFLEGGNLSGGNYKISFKGLTVWTNSYSVVNGTKYQYYYYVPAFTGTCKELREYLNTLQREKAIVDTE